MGIFREGPTKKTNNYKKNSSTAATSYARYRGVSRFPISWQPCGVNGREVAISTSMEGLGAVLKIVCGKYGKLYNYLPLP